jgi:hypothetical protein
MLRASELAIGHGYRFFAFAGAADVSRAAAITTPGVSTTTASAHVTGTPYMATGTATSTTVDMPPVTTTLLSPGAAVTVALSNAGGLDAQIIHAQLAPRYGALQNW